MNMIITHKAAVAEFGSPYRINKEIKANRLFRVARGFYSDTRYVDPYALCAMRYPGAIVTMDSAFYLHGLLAVISQWLRRDCPEDVETLAAFLSRHVPQGG